MSKESNVKVMACHCKHAYQDEKYGKNQRVHNHAPKAKVWRCTVCSSGKPA